MHKQKRRFLRNCLFITALNTVLSTHAPAQETIQFESTWPSENRVWIGPEYWANRLQDWQLADGRLECVSGFANKPMRTVHLIPYRLGNNEGKLVTSVRTGILDRSTEIQGIAYNAASGFLIGAGASIDKRGAALIHNTPGPEAGIFAGISGSGKAFIHDFEQALAIPLPSNKNLEFAPDGKTAIYYNTLHDVFLTLAIDPKGDQYQIILVAKNAAGERIDSARALVEKHKVIGNIALVSHPGGNPSAERYAAQEWESQRRQREKWSSATARFWYRDWKISGTKLEGDPAHTIGPILSTQYTIHNEILKVTAQFLPLSPENNLNARLQIRHGQSDWKNVAKAEINLRGCIAIFRVKDWTPQSDTDYRVVYVNGKNEIFTWEGIIRKNPTNKENIVVATLAGTPPVTGSLESPFAFGVDQPFQENTFNWKQNVHFPYTDLVQNVASHNPDLLVFSGNQVYGGNPTRAVRAPINEAHLDYLYKWFLWCWTWRNLTKNTPSIIIPGDRDYYQAHLWGESGSSVQENDIIGSYGGFRMSSMWVNMMQQTQTGHLPDPIHPMPMQSGIEVFYTQLNLGRVGFAIIEDHKYKSSPLAARSKINRDGLVTQQNFNPADADNPGATLLGESQLLFLQQFAHEWTQQDMKVVISQDTFASPTIPDLSTNAWPQTGRYKALALMRSASMFHMASDPYSSNAMQHGIEKSNDAIWSFSTQSTPAETRQNTSQQESVKTGPQEDKFQNKIDVKTVSQPYESTAGKTKNYGIVQFDINDRAIHMACWPTDANAESGSPLPGWPVSINQSDNDGRKPLAYLPRILIEGMKNPVIQVIGDANEQVVYTIRINGTDFQPKVYAPGNYTVKIGELPDGPSKTLKSLKASRNNKETLTVSF